MVCRKCNKEGGLIHGSLGTDPDDGKVYYMCNECLEKEDRCLECCRNKVDGLCPNCDDSQDCGCYPHQRCSECSKYMRPLDHFVLPSGSLLFFKH